MNYNNLFITSDLHFWHKNIILYCYRPYEMTIDGIVQMNEDILREFDKLPKGSIILNLGDFSLNSNISFNELKILVDRMRRNDKHLWIVLGNHDRDTMDYHTGHSYTNPRDFFTALGFERVYEFPILLEEKFLLSHEPVYLKPGSNIINIHGHTHQCLVDGNYFNRDCENWGMMEIVKKHMVTKQKNLDIDTSVKPYEKLVDVSNYQNVCWDYIHSIIPFESIVNIH